jgi:hypothetical protein
MYRILYFVHYNKYNSLSDQVIYLLKNIRKGPVVFKKIYSTPLYEISIGGKIPFKRHKEAPPHI